MRYLPASAAPAPLPADIHCFGPKELASGWRLGCRHAAVHGLQVALPHNATMAVSSRDVSFRDARQPGLQVAQYLPVSPDPGPGPDPEPGFGLALDLGTTSLAWSLLPLETRPGQRPLPLWQGSMLNPQMGAGSDVVSRLTVAADPKGAERLQQRTLDAIRSLLREARAKAAEASHGSTVIALCLAANPAMTAITLGFGTGGLAAAPYSLPVRGGRWMRLEGMPPFWIPPQLSPFVGGDVSAGYAYLAMQDHPPEYPFVLADMGTNGEFILALGPARALTASVALGPALEGSGLSQGTTARPGAVAGFTLRPTGLEPLVLNKVAEEVAGQDTGEAADQLRLFPLSPGQRLEGITGTGYLSLLNILLTCGALRRDGGFSATAPALLGRSVFVGDSGGEPCLFLGHGLLLRATDVEELLKVKAAFSLGLRRLLTIGGISSVTLTNLFLGGALGTHMDKRAMENLGFLPQGLGARFRTIGNSALQGAEFLLRNHSARDALVRWAAGASDCNLAEDPEFHNQFISKMHFSW